MTNNYVVMYLTLAGILCGLLSLVLHEPKLQIVTALLFAYPAGCAAGEAMNAIRGRR
jgi:hypothetical protein